MSARSRTNQLLYQAELLIETPVHDDEHYVTRQMAIEEGALALFELALESFLAEVTEHARLDTRRWQTLLAADGPELAELIRLRDLAGQPESWLGWLIGALLKLHGDEGAAKRPINNPSMIALASEASFASSLYQSVQAAKKEMTALRETSHEW
ncbi:DUF6586 family protein [Halomonas sp. GD1P12]|uniref:DUF6586 family protein n=1 Tax=Halomonas sp. GD1P12 TaxID=2982691 RepID=UPI0021E48DBF|nr:DUF6586 family protein [Halomonas sp. GD1P12]UYG01337.1 hypothetical protein OCT39_07225 [Halomonas sp. GD1P12]